MTCATCGGPITATFCSKCGAPVAAPAPAPAPSGAYAAPSGAYAAPLPYAAPPLASPYGSPPGPSPYAPPAPPADATGTTNWAPLPPYKPRKSRGALKIIGLVVLALVALVVVVGIVNPNHVPRADEMSDWHVGACVRITDSDGSAYPVKCEKSNDGYITAQVASGPLCPTRMYVTRPDAVWCVQVTDPTAVENIPEGAQ
jgi:hypothetical protein